jgi:hypothetical protein
MKREWIRLVAWAALVEVLLLIGFLSRAKSAGPEDVLYFLLAVSQLPGLQVMAWIFPKEAEGGTAWITFYYMGVALAQIPVVAALGAAIRTLLQRRGNSLRVQ